MNELLLVLLGGVVSALTEFSKKFFKQMNPLFVVAIVSLILGFVYSFLMSKGFITEDMLKSWGAAFASAVAIYNIFKEVQKSNKTSSETKEKEAQKAANPE